MKKTLITIFAIIGVISTVLMLLGVGYILGTKDRTSAPVSTVTATPEPTVAVETVAPTETPVPTSIPTPTVAPTATSTPSPTATSTPTPISTATPSPTPKYTFTDINEQMDTIGAINLCDTPNRRGNIVGSVPEGATITVIKKCDQSYWYFVDYNGLQGYIHPDIYKAMKDHKATSSYTYTDIIGMDKPKRALSEINVYSEPTKDSAIKGKAPLDVIIEALQICNETGLMKVVYNVRGCGDVTGWVDPAYLVSAVENPSNTPTNNQTNKEENKTQEETTKPSTENTTKPSGNDSTAQKPTPTPKPSNPGHSASDPFYGSQFADYAPSGEKFTDTAIIDGVQTNISGTIKVAGYVIVEGIKNTGTPVEIQTGEYSTFTAKEIRTIRAAYQYIYGEENAEVDYIGENNLMIIRIYPGYGNIIDSDIELNTN